MPLSPESILGRQPSTPVHRSVREHHRACLLRIISPGISLRGALQDLQIMLTDNQLHGR